MQGHGQDQAHRLAEVQEAADAPVVKDLGRAGQVPGRGQHPGLSGEPVAGVAEHLGVVVDVDDPGIGPGRLRGLVRVRGGRQAAAHIQELADPGLGYVGDGAGLELAGLAGQLPGVREDLQHLGRLGPVGCEVVLAAEEEIVDPGDTGDLRVELDLRDPQLGPQPVGSLRLGKPGCTPAIVASAR